MPTLPRPMPQGAHRPSPPDVHASSMAQRLGVSELCLLDYLAANGGAPDGAQHDCDVTPEVLDERLTWFALPEQAGGARPRARWVKRDRPRYFMPG